MKARWLRIAAWLALVYLGAAVLTAPGPAQSTGVAYSIELNSDIDPASADWLGHALDDAANTDADVVIIRLDTPGGLSDSMHQMVKDILAAPMPVIVYVYPNGARAASAGVFITQAADVAAMAPETNIGAATPISSTGGDIGGTLGRKITNDAAAQIRALANTHNRNGELSAEMVTQAKSISAAEAKSSNVIDVIATSERDLLDKLDGFEVSGPKAQTLHTSGLTIEEHDTPFTYELLGIIVNPTIAYLLLLVGIAGLGIELLTGFGTILPGAIGFISLLLGLYASAQLPVTLTGIILLLAGVALVIAEAHLPTHGILGALGAACLVISGLVLYNTNSSAFEVSAPVVIVVSLLIAGGIGFAAHKAIAARRRPVRTGWEEMIGAEADVRVALKPVGQVFVEGALWRARAVGDETIETGARVRVKEVDGLTLTVERALPASSGEPEAAPAEAPAPL